MEFKENAERMRKLLSDTISLLCKNGLSYTQEFQIEGLLGITLDRKDVFLVNIKELVSNNKTENHQIDHEDFDYSADFENNDYSADNGDGNHFDMRENTTTDEVAIKQKNRSLTSKHEVESAIDIDLTQMCDITFSTHTRPNNINEFEPPEPPIKKAALIKEENEDPEVEFMKEECEPDNHMQSYILEDSFSAASQGKSLLQQQAPLNLMPSTPTSFNDTSTMDSSQRNVTPQAFRNSQLNTPSDDERRQQQTPRSQTYQCDKQGCGSVFKHKRNLTQHRKKHINIYPYNCPYCNKGIGNSKNVKNHLKVNHTGLFGFHCIKCRKEFENIHKLRDHLQQNNCSVGNIE